MYYSDIIDSLCRWVLVYWCLKMFIFNNPSIKVGVGGFSGCVFFSRMTNIIIVEITWTIVCHAALAETGSKWAKQTQTKVAPCSNVLHTIKVGQAEQSPFASGRISIWWQLDMRPGKCEMDEGESCMYMYVGSDACTNTQHTFIIVQILVIHPVLDFLYPFSK